MNILDLIAIIAIIIGAYRGWKYGGFSTIISLIGTLLVFVIAYYLKNPISTLLYENMPFRNFGGIFSGITSFNILVYEGIAYAICIIILTAILRIILKLTGIIDKIINLTLVFALPSKILGLIFGALEFYIYTFVILFILAQLPLSAEYFKDSTFGMNMLSQTPLLSNVTNDLYHSISEVYEICANKSSDKTEEADYNSLEVLLKYEVITPESVKKLDEKGKLNIDNVDELIKKYQKE